MFPMIPIAAATASIGAAWLIKRLTASQITIVDANNLTAKPRPTALEECHLLFAAVTFMIDGEIAPAEEQYLDHLIQKMPVRHLQSELEDGLARHYKLVLLRNRYNALPEDGKREIERLMTILVTVDNERTVEEEALLIQFSQIIDGNEPLDLYVATSRHRPESTQGDVFHYLEKQEFETRFPATSCAFQASRIYIEHPYIDGALVPFSAEDFNESQDRMYQGLVALLKDLGAKQVVISELSEEKSNDKSATAAGIDVKAGPVVAVKLKASGSVGSELLSKQTQDLRVDFDGSRPKLIDRVLKGRWQKRMLQKYAGNAQYRMIIEGRFGSNKMKFFSYKVRSIEAKKVAKAINAAAKYDQKLVKVGADMSASTSSGAVTTMEKILKIKFY